MIDVHCHVDMYKNPKQVLDESEKLGIITIGVTNLPSHFELGYPHFLQRKKVRLALGMHPLLAESHEKEFPKFAQNLEKTSYIGEIGLDFSSKGISTKEIQVRTFKRILSLLAGCNKILSIHSRRAEQEVLEYLIDSRASNAVFHWYSGPLKLLDRIVDAGYSFSVNPAMVSSNHSHAIIRRIPRTHLLTESDGPFATLNGVPTKPSDVHVVCNYLSRIWNESEEAVVDQISRNFTTLLSQVR